MPDHTLIATAATCSDTLTTTESSRLVALAAPNSVVHPRVIASLARYGTRGERVGMLIGDNRFELYSLTRLAHRHGYDPGKLLRQIELSRAFTCHQLHRRVMTIDRTMIPRWRALYVLGLLDTFYDESVPASEAVHLLVSTMKRLQELKCYGLDILVTAARPKKPGREKLLEIIARYADEYVEYCEPAVPVRTGASSPQLFG